MMGAFASLAAALADRYRIERELGQGDVTPDGQRFLMLRWPTGEVRRRVLITTGWWPELRALVESGTAP